MDRRCIGLLLSSTLAWLGCAQTSDVCQEAADIISGCTGDPAVAPPKCVGEARAFSEAVVQDGCYAVQGDDKADGWTQLCQPHLKRWFGLWPSWCNPEAIVCEPTQAELDPERCNGSAELCDRRYDQVVYATTHNAFNVARLEFFRPNQSYRMFRQLRDGVRALMLDTHDPDGGDVRLCHEDCKHGSQTLTEGLGEIRSFLDCYPNEVVTLLIQPELADPRLQLNAFRATGLDQMAYTHEPGKPWPTLRELIDSGKRLVVMAEVLPDDEMPGWYHFMWDHTFDNNFHAESKSDFGCELERGDPEKAALFGLNHFLTLDIFGQSLGGDAWAAIGANEYDSLMAHIDECTGVYGRTPNFLSVDFYDSGAVLDITNELNALGPTQP